MTIIEELSQLSDQELAKKSGELFADCEGLQRRVLADILHTAQKTEFGLKNDFDQLTTAELFRRHMPLTTWTDYEAYSTRMQTGEADVTFPGKAQCFTLSSSTTSTRAKYIPDSTLQLVARKLVERMRQICYFMVLLERPEVGTVLAICIGGPVCGRTPSPIAQDHADDGRWLWCQRG